MGEKGYINVGCAGIFSYRHTSSPFLNKTYLPKLDEFSSCSSLHCFQNFSRDISCLGLRKFESYYTIEQNDELYMYATSYVFSAPKDLIGTAVCGYGHMLRAAKSRKACKLSRCRRKLLPRPFSRPISYGFMKSYRIDPNGAAGRSMAFGVVV